MSPKRKWAKIDMKHSVKQTFVQKYGSSMSEIICKSSSQAFGYSHPTHKDEWDVFDVIINN